MNMKNNKKNTSDNFVNQRINLRTKLRKEKIEDILTSRRNIYPVLDSIKLNELLNIPQEISHRVFDNENEKIEFYKSLISSDNESYQMFGLFQILNILQTQIELVCKVAQDNYIQTLFSLVKNKDLIFKILSINCLNQILYPENSNIFTYNYVDKDNFLSLKDCLQIDSVELKKAIIHLIGNMILNLNQIRNLVDKYDLLNEIFSKIEGILDTGLISMSAWMFNIFVDLQEKKHEVSIVKKYSSKLLCKFLEYFYYSINNQDKEILCSSIWGISKLSVYCDDHDYNLILESNLIEKIFENKIWDNPSLTLATIRIIGNILTSEEINNIEIICKKNAVEPIIELISSNSKLIKKECLWALANFSQTGNYYCELLLSHGIYDKVVNCLKDNDYEIRKESIYLLSSIIFYSSPHSIYELYKQGMCLTIGNFLLTEANFDLNRITLYMIMNILEISDENSLFDVIETFFSLKDKLLEFTSVKNNTISELSNKILTFLTIKSDKNKDEMFIN